MTDNELWQIARTLKTWCEEHKNCIGCPFSDGICLLYGHPEDWELDETEEEE